MTGADLWIPMSSFVASHILFGLYFFRTIMIPNLIELAYAGDQVCIEVLAAIHASIRTYFVVLLVFVPLWPVLMLHAYIRANR
jgi:hypothetical protein